jgi:hypothetical protein
MHLKMAKDKSNKNKNKNKKSKSKKKKESSKAPKDSLFNKESVDGLIVLVTKRIQQLSPDLFRTKNEPI